LHEAPLHNLHNIDFLSIKVVEATHIEMSRPT
jgi:hypothetical protein